MPRKTPNINSLARGRVRASMNKFNLFNLYKKPSIKLQNSTLYQQKFRSKQETRAYHGEHLTERRWKQIFNPNLESVAQLDASLKGSFVEETPLVLQTYASLEKRLEFAVFRSMFASSIRQARQFILNGHVKVNDVVIKHPAYPLKAGDLFSVNPEKVLIAMGRTKPSLEQAVKVDNKQIGAYNRYVKKSKEAPREVWEFEQSKPASLNTIDEHADTRIKGIKDFNESLEKNMLQEQRNTTREAVLSKILTTASSEESVTAQVFENLYGKRNAERCFLIYDKLKKADHKLIKEHSIEDAKTFITTKSNEFASEAQAKLASGVKKPLQEIVSHQLEYLRVSAQSGQLPESSKELPFDPEFNKDLDFHPKLDKDAVLEDESSAVVDLPWQKGLFGREDPAKPYFSPWTPRPFIGAFAILPSHIEINFPTCHAVYLRDPVARPGHSEVISPFHTEIHKRAYMFYVRKGL